MSDWTGSSRQRREQGLCLPPQQPKRTVSAYQIPAGTKVLIASVLHVQWFSYVTRAELGFTRTEQKKHGFYYFRHLGWLIRVPCHLTKKNTTA